MKKLLSAVLWGAFFFTVSCSSKPSMKIVDSVAMPYTEIRGIAAEGPFDIVVTDHPEWGIQFRANKYLMKKVRYGMNGSLLWLRLDPVHIEENSVLEVYVPARSLSTLSLRGAAYAYIEYPQIVQGSADYSLSGASALVFSAPAMFAGDWMLSASGGSEVIANRAQDYLDCSGRLLVNFEDASKGTLARVTAVGNQSFSLTGASELKLAGQVIGTGNGTTQFILDGGSKAEAVEYAAQNVTVTAAGASSAAVRTGRSLVYRLSGLSRLDYYCPDVSSLSVTELSLSGGSTAVGHEDAGPVAAAAGAGETGAEAGQGMIRRRQRR